MRFTLKDRLRLISNQIKNGRLKYLWNVFVKQIFSEEIAFGFKRDLNKEFNKPRALMDVSIRVFEDSDSEFFKGNPNNGLINHFNTCYVAINKDGVPCSRLWLIDSSQNDKLKFIWRGTFPQLGEDELLIENVYTVPKYRGFGILPVFMNEIANKAKIMGANYVITFGAVNNNNTSRSFHYVGFEPYIIRKTNWFLFKKRVLFKDIPEDLKKHFQKITMSKRPRKTPKK